MPQDKNNIAKLLEDLASAIKKYKKEKTMSDVIIEISYNEIKSLLTNQSRENAKYELEKIWEAYGSTPKKGYNTKKINKIINTEITAVLLKELAEKIRNNKI